MGGGSYCALHIYYTLVCGTSSVLVLGLWVKNTLLSDMSTTGKKKRWLKFCADWRISHVAGHTCVRERNKGNMYFKNIDLLYWLIEK